MSTWVLRREAGYARCIPIATLPHYLTVDRKRYPIRVFGYLRSNTHEEIISSCF